MIKLTVNGHDHQVDVDPETPLLYVLRGELALNGAKFGCGLGQCGACTVMVDGRGSRTSSCRQCRCGSRRCVASAGT